MITVLFAASVSDLHDYHVSNKLIVAGWLLDLVVRFYYQGISGMGAGIICILLSIVTCGIYAIIWFINMTDDASQSSGEEMSGGMAFLLTLVTCGIYGFYWAYKMGKMMEKAGQNKNVSISDNSTIYLVLNLLNLFGLGFGLGIVNYCLIQNDLNKIARQGN